MAQSVLQISSVAKFTGADTAAPSLTGVSTGSDLLELVGFNTFSGSTAVASVSDGASYTQEASQLFDSANQAGLFVFRRRGVSAGSYTATCTAVSGSYGQCVLVEVSGDANAAADQTSGNTGSGTALTVGPTGTLSQANEIVLALFAGNGGINFGTGTAHPAAGYTEIYFDQADLEMPVAFAYQVVTSNAAVSAALTAQNTVLWAGLLATFVSASVPLAPTAGAAVISGTTVARGQGTRLIPMTA